MKLSFFLKKVKFQKYKNWIKDKNNNKNTKKHDKDKLEWIEEKIK